MQHHQHAHTTGAEVIQLENKSHKGNYKGTTHMKAKNQDMAFVNDHMEDAKSVSNFAKQKKTDK
jgi:hypothetical protein